MLDRFDLVVSPKRAGYYTACGFAGSSCASVVKKNFYRLRNCGLFRSLMFDRLWKSCQFGPLRGVFQHRGPFRSHHDPVRIMIVTLGFETAVWPSPRPNAFAGTSPDGFVGLLFRFRAQERCSVSRVCVAGRAPYYIRVTQPSSPIYCCEQPVVVMQSRLSFSGPVLPFFVQAQTVSAAHFP